MKDKPIIHDILFYAFALIVAGILIFACKDGGIIDEKKIVGIDIKGEVYAEGYYEFEYGSRVKDAIIAAGGETEEADLSTINLAMILVDGQEIVIPSKIENDIRSDGKININTADMYKLTKLDGIGNSLATNIVEYRAEKGPFKKVEDIKKVKGIGKEKFENIKDKITVE